MSNLLLRACMVLAFGVQLCSGQEIRVRLINAKTGAPYIGKERTVALDFYDSMPTPTSRSEKKIGERLQGVQDSDGVATFHLPEPPPPVVRVYADFPFHSTIVCAAPSFWTTEVLRSGVVSENECDRKGKLKGRFVPKPGEIILFIRRFTVWDTL